jgi:hypothetical protein
MAKNKAVPIKLCFVDTGSSLGTGINEKISIFLSILIGNGDVYYLINDSFNKLLKLFFYSPESY